MRTLLEIERRYWVEKDIPWHIVTEKEIPSVVVKISIGFALQSEMIIHHETLLERVQFFAHHFQKTPNRL